MISRVSTLSMQKSMLDQLTKNQLSYYDAQTQALTGKRISTVSDDPIGSAKIITLNEKLSKLSNYKTNVATAQEEYSVLDSTLSEITDKLQRVNELNVEAANGTNTDATRAAIKTEIDQIKETIVDLANTQYNGQYIFGGANTLTQPYSIDTATGSIVYSGTPATGDGQRQIDVAEGVSLTLNVTGDSLLGSYTDDGTTKTGSGVFGALAALSNALGTPPDTAAIASSINSVKAGLETVSSIRSKYGGYAERADMYASSIAENNTLLSDQKSGIENIDLAEAYSRLSAQQYALQASMQVYASSMSLSLLNYM